MECSKKFGVRVLWPGLFIAVWWLAVGAQTRRPLSAGGVKLANALARRQSPPTPRIANVTTNNKSPGDPFEELQGALDEANVNVECGRVPMFERAHNRSINEPFAKRPNEDSGTFRILHGLNAER